MCYRSILLAFASASIAHPCLAQSAGEYVGAERELTAEEQKADNYVPAVVDADAASVVRGLNSFTAELYRAVADGKGDLAISPASVSLAFALAHAGAKGETRDEIARVLHYPTGLADFDKSTGSLVKSMQLNATGRTMAVNNSIWLQTGLPVHASYLSGVERHYGAGLNRVDYQSNPDAARETINGWVLEKTRGKIRNLLSPEHVTSGTKSVLVNTVYFKADWGTPFERDATRVEDFSLESGRKIKLPLMHQDDHFRFAEVGGVKAIALPYRGGETEMIILLPKSGGGLAKLEKSLTGQELQGWTDKLNRSDLTEVILTLPKFKIESEFGLVGSLKALGMKIPFSDQSDFSGMKPVNMTSSDPNDWNLQIGAVIHKVFVEVDEKGTEAAAATAIVQELVMSALRGPPPPPPEVFKADHPFLFAIRDTRTGALLFLGRFVGPEAE